MVNKLYIPLKTPEKQKVYFVSSQSPQGLARKRLFNAFAMYISYGHTGQRPPDKRLDSPEIQGPNLAETNYETH